MHTFPLKGDNKPWEKQILLTGIYGKYHRTLLPKPSQEISSLDA